jgi:integral membrane sensor domain MASE1
LALLAFALLVFGAAELGQLVIEPATPGSFPAFWPPVGVLLGALVIDDRRRALPLVLVAVATMSLSLALHGRGAVAIIGISAVAALDARLAATFVTRAIDGPLALDRLTHAVVLIAAAATAPLVGATIAASLPSLVDVSTQPWRAWYLADAVGMIVTAPLVVALLRTTAGAVQASFRGSRALELPVVLVAGIAVIAGVFGGRLEPALRVPALLLPFALWPAFRLGSGGAAVSVFVLSFVSLWYAARGQGPIAIFAEGALVLRAQAAVAIMGATLFLLASVVAERTRVARERDALVGRLQQALAEIKTLRGFIPICAWCHKVRDDAGFWQELEQYLDSRTDATFSHGICPGCAEEQRREIDAHLHI